MGHICLYMGGIMGHILTNIGRSMGPNFESEWHVPIKARISFT